MGEALQALPIGTGYAVWSNRYMAGNGWTAAERIGSYGGLIGTFTPNIAVDPGNGDAFAIWTRGGEVWVNQFTSTETLRWGIKTWAASPGNPTHLQYNP